MSDTQTLSIEQGRDVEQGWYDDPTEPAFERWWTGSAWTETRRVSTTTVPPEPTPRPTIIPGIALSDLSHEKHDALFAPPTRRARLTLRLLARLADDLLVAGVPLVAVTVLRRYDVSWLGSLSSNDAIGLVLTLSLVNHVLLVACFGTSAGKRLLRLEIVDHHGRKPSPWRTVIRYVAETIVLATFALPFALIPTDATTMLDDVARIGAEFLYLFIISGPVLMTGRTAWDRLTRTTVVKA